MKKLLLTVTTVLMVATAGILFTSCQKEKEVSDTENSPVVEIFLSNGSNTKAFFDDKAEAEIFEKQISSLTVLVFDKDDKFVVRRKLNVFEIEGRSCSFALPKTVAGTKCSFYAVANFSTDDVTSKSELLALLDSNPGDYNGTFQEVTTSAKREDGFVMSGFTEKTIAQSGSSTEVELTLKRIVAKIAVKAEISDTFYENYGGKLTILSTKIENAPSAGYVIEPETSSSSISTSYSATQDVPSDPNALYYIFSNEHITDHGSVTLFINASYDLDGKDTTTDDKYEFSYEIPLNGSGSGIIKRNGYYRVAATIDGPEGEDCSFSIIVSDWESPSTQDINLGI